MTTCNSFLSCGAGTFNKGSGVECSMDAGSCNTNMCCEACESSCNACSSSTTCTQCTDSKYLHSGHCVDTCPNGYRGSGGTDTTGLLCEVDIVRLSGTALQSSTHNSPMVSRGADKATDDDESTMAHTREAGEGNPWWQLDLGSSMEIHKVRVLNRPTRCASRIFLGTECAWEYNPRPGTFDDDTSQGADFYLGDASCSGNVCPGTRCGRLETPKTSGDHWYDLTCSGDGRYVAMMLPGANRILNVMEIEVFGRNGDERRLKGFLQPRQATR